ncbi:MAG: hypothetical protein H8E66_15830 [Planctomycetes bacterium]|nr:hypothetical protein [Planctomycetota bacterium]
MRATITIIVLLVLQNVGSGQLIRPIRERLPGEIELAADVPAEFVGKATLTFVELSVIFDGGSYGATFRCDNDRDVAIYFLHPGYWTKQAIKNETQPIVVDLYRDEEKAKLEVERDSPFEKRLIELLTNDLSNRELSPEQIKTLIRIRECIRTRQPLTEIRKRFPKAFDDE